MPTETRLQFLKSLTEREAESLFYDWSFWARPEQIEPVGDWRVWLVLAGRGFGKTRTGAEWIRARAESQLFRRFALVGSTAADVRDVMVEGESGILACSSPKFMPIYQSSKRRLTWPNGAIAICYSGDEPDQLRGPQHDSVWADEPQKWRYGIEAWDNMEFGLRIGPKPQAVATGTPLPIKLIKDLVFDPQTVVTRGSTYDNLNNLAPSFIKRVVRKYEGTRLGRQELRGEILDDTPGALWTRGNLDQYRVRKIPTLVRVVVGVDPNASSGEDGAETGIVVAGLGVDGHGYVLDDLSLRASPAMWATAAVAGYYKHRADRIIGESNNGGEMVEHTIRTADKTVSFRSVHASRGKATRAEPISAMYEQGTVHHVGMFADLEDQLCEWVPAVSPKSPDRMDALVWALTELMIPTEREEKTATSAATTRRSPFK